MGLTPPHKPGSQQREEERQKRLAQALRANLLKRKEQARLREELLKTEKENNELQSKS